MRKQRHRESKGLAQDVTARWHLTGGFIPLLPLTAFYFFFLCFSFFAFFSITVYFRYSIVLVSGVQHGG